MERCPEVDAKLEEELRKVCKTLVLASQSPNRRSVLEHAGLKVIAKPQDILEICGFTEPASVVETLASQKLQSYLSSKDFNPELPAVGVDTLVYLDGKLMGKPHDNDEARQMISAFSGRWHQVYSGLCVYLPGKGVTTIHDITKVHFKAMTDQEIDWYVSTGDCQGAAGAYKIQSNGYKLIDAIDGSFSNIIGIPLEKLLEILR